jgi:hypothetical protein
MTRDHRSMDPRSTPGWQGPQQPELAVVAGSGGPVVRTIYARARCGMIEP